MGGWSKTSTNDVTTRAELSLYSRLRMETASEDTLRLSGHLLKESLFVIVMHFCLTSLPVVNSQAIEQERICGPVTKWDLVLELIVML